jgi:hypothetical protein
MAITSHMSSPGSPFLGSLEGFHRFGMERVRGLKKLFFPSLGDLAGLDLMGDVEHMGLDLYCNATSI